MKVSVVIPTYQTEARRGLVVRALEGLSRQTLARELFEVLVIDDGSPLPVADAVTPFVDRIPVRCLRKPNSGLAATRNFGASQATGDILLFLDDDILPCPEFLEAHRGAHLADDRAVALGSLPHPDDLPLTPFLYYLNRVVHYDLFLRYGAAERIPLPPLNGNSSLLRRHFEAAQGYDLAFSSYGGEDTEMGYRLVKRGLHFVYVPGARGFHYHVKGFAAYEKDMYSSGVTMVEIVRRHPEVLARVNLDVVHGLAPGARQAEEAAGAVKRAKRIGYRLLERYPRLVKLLQALIRGLEPLGLKRPLYPLYYVVGHYFYALGMRDEIARAGLAGAPR